MILLGKHEPHKVLGKPRASGDDPMNVWVNMSKLS